MAKATAVFLSGQERNGYMPRGKKKVVNIAEKIEAVKAEIEALTTQLKEKKAELKKLEAEQAEEDKAKLIEAFTVSGKGIDTRGTVLCVLTESRLHVFGPATTDHVLSCDCARFLKSRHPPEFQQR